MNDRIDQVIHKLDALMNGAQPGDTEPPPFVPDTMDAMRGVVRELVVDCRTCDQHHWRAGACVSRVPCVNGDRYHPVDFKPKWVVKS